MSFVCHRNKFEQRYVYFPLFYPTLIIDHQVPWSKYFSRNSTMKLRRTVELFLHLIENSSINEFLQHDEDFRYADKFLLAMVLIYFSRAKFHEEHFTKESFYIALWLAHDSVEEDLTAKYALLPWAFQIDDQRSSVDIKNDFKEFLTKKNDLWTRMKFRARVTEDQCDAIISIEPNHWIWQRQRTNDYQMKIGTFHREKVSNLSIDDENQSVPSEIVSNLMDDDHC